MHIVIKDALPNFELVKREILSNAIDTKRAKRGGPNAHSVKWFKSAEIPMAAEAMGHIAKQYMASYNTSPDISFSDATFEYQLIEYNTPGDQYHWHIDGVISADGSKSRRMTMALNLTAKGDDFIGDGFQLSTVTGRLDNDNLARVAASNFASAFTQDEAEILSQRNSIVIFNPDTIHRGSPIVSGKRQLLTAWVNW